MNPASYPRFLDRVHSWLNLHTRLLDSTQSGRAFDLDDTTNAIQRIYVINLDRQPERWRQVSRELDRLRVRSGDRMSSISRRFPAFDSRLIQSAPNPKVIEPYYSLGDQMVVEPIPQLSADDGARARQIRMTQQEVAVALSHIGVWGLIAGSDVPYTLVVEDDIYFRRGFIHKIDEAWPAIQDRDDSLGPVDFLYLSFKEAGGRPHSRPASGALYRPQPGIWQLSGYVLSPRGARKLLNSLPASGPIDLWLNLQFGELEVLATRHPIIEQRRGVPSNNSYSVLPVLSQVGVLTRERPLLVRNRKLSGPIFALGESDSGLTGLAAALSILGFRCCSDVTALPAIETANLFGKRNGRAFNAYVNVGTLGPDELTGLAKLYRTAKFIITVRDREGSARNRRRAWTTEGAPRPNDYRSSASWLSGLSSEARGRILFLPRGHPDKWELLQRFLDADYPAAPYPDRPDLGQRSVSRLDDVRHTLPRTRRLKFDSSPWIVPLPDWRGISTAEVEGGIVAGPPIDPGERSGDMRWEDSWTVRDDTFPSNLALFRPHNFLWSNDGIAKLTLRSERTTVRALTSAAIATRQTFRYGRFSAGLRPSSVPGVITGMFLHRNAPRQEIDLEFLGRDTSRILVNVFYNPGEEGTPLEYGYRGTPTLIDLGFDASEDMHRYEIDWGTDVIRWLVDGSVVHERSLWAPTPIPDMPMQYNINLWPSRSRELAGDLSIGQLPAVSEVRIPRSATSAR